MTSDDSETTSHLDALQVTGLGTVLGVWAHPDDEAYLSAGVMAMARDRGQRVAVATATVGEAGGVRGSRSLRRQELEAGLAAVGVEEHYWLGFHDGRCTQVDPVVGVAAVQRVLRQVDPDTILTFGPDGMTGHPDHVAVGRWVRQAWSAEGRRADLLNATLTEDFHRRWGTLSREAGVWMPGAQPPSVPDAAVALRVTVTGSTSERKLAALRAHASQTEALRKSVGEATYAHWWAEEAFVRVPRQADAGLDEAS